MAALVDVVFLLLIFFMVTTVFPENDGLAIEKPTSENAAPLPREPVIVLLDKDGNTHMDGHPVTGDDITRLLQALPPGPVTIHADRRATTEALVGVIDAAKSGGATPIGIATDTP